ncbi:MFS transporter [Novosphingobium resinovorum]|uniref:MFS transporter n=1 Tax=Novosphingobium TaxID=165696 RepID=UPI002003AD8D|nr:MULTISPECIES: MFS transporter [Novosphingobium]WJM27971.1 MFS transporter [Novosphingobium resinovorum]
MSLATEMPRDVAAPKDEHRERLYAKVTWRLMPFLFFCFFAAYLDRVNVGFAKLQMASELGLSEYVYGLGAGIFFIGYALFEVPSNLIMHKVGARLWIARIMITWGIISGLFAFAQTPMHFYILRFLLGLAEAGFAPGVLLYITYWFPSARRSRAMSIFFIAIPISGVLGSPLSGWIMDTFHGSSGWGGWRWLFLLEAIPALIAGIATFWMLPNRPADVDWLSADDKKIIEADLAEDNREKTAHMSLRQFLADKRLWLLSLLYFCIVMGQYAISFWLPTMVKAAGVTDPLENGLISAIPFLFAVVVILVLARSADLRRERRFHLMLPMAMGAIALALSPLAIGNLPLSVLILSFATAGLLTQTAQFWSIPPAFLGGVWAAAGIGAINAIGNVAGFVSPFVIGWVVDATKSLSAGLYTITAVELIGVALVLLIPARQVNR